MKNASFIGGILLGIVAGTIVGILFAPDKGSETRKKITNKGGELAGNLKDKVSGAFDGVLGKSERMKEKANSMH